MVVIFSWEEQFLTSEVLYKPYKLIQLHKSFLGVLITWGIEGGGLYNWKEKCFGMN